MRLTSFGVSNYRSITSSRAFELGSATVLIGPNNEGKTNLLRAVVTVLRIVRDLSRARYRAGRLSALPPLRAPLPRGADPAWDRDYVWTRDFPIRLQARHPDGESIFQLTFELNDIENETFARQVGSTLNGILPIELRLGRDQPYFKVRKQGLGQKVLSQKFPTIAAFISDHFDFEYIPAVRTAEDARGTVERLVARALVAAEQDPRYGQALALIEELQAPVVREIEAGVLSTLQESLPEVRLVEVRSPAMSTLRGLRRSVELIVDDGVPTSLQDKGDGVQSLAAMGLIRHAVMATAGTRNLVLAIEEPESHLHADATHRMRRVLVQLAERQQILLTTHSPVFIDRSDLSNNIVVRRNRAEPARSITELREALGVRAADNLRGADMILVVEGESDRTFLSSTLSKASAEIDSRLRSGSFAVEPLGGASNLVTRIADLTNWVSLFHAVLDDDEGGRSAYEAARAAGRLEIRDATLLTVPGQAQAEIEDLVEMDIYRQLVFDRYGVDLASRHFRTNRKWSTRVAEVFRRHGKPLDDNTLAEIKLAVANIATDRDLADVLHPARRSAFDALVVAVEDKLSRIGARR